MISESMVYRTREGTTYILIHIVSTMKQTIIKLEFLHKSDDDGSSYAKAAHIF